VSEDTLVSNSTDGTWERSYTADVGGIAVTDVLRSPLAPVQFIDTVTLPPGWSVRQESNGDMSLLDGVGEVTGHVSAPVAVDAAGTPVLVQRTLAPGNRILTDILHTAGVTVYPITVDPYHYMGGELTDVGQGARGNEHFNWRSATQYLYHYHKEFPVNEDGTQSADFRYIEDAEVPVRLSQSLNGRQVRNVFSLRLLERPIGYDERMALEVTLRCKVNVPRSKDPACPGVPDFKFDNRSKPSDWRALYNNPDPRPGTVNKAITPDIRLPALPSSVTRQRYFFEVYVRPYLPDGENGELIPGGDTGKYRTYDVTCVRNADPETGQRCYFDRSVPPGSGG
jgi:hypothetical protein